MYLKILRFRGDRAICATDIGKDLDVRRTLLPVTASVGDVFKLGINETYDGFLYTPISDKEYRKHRQLINKLRNREGSRNEPE